jgi:hypothetical protein
MKNALHGRTILWRDHEVLSDEVVPRGDLRHPIVDDSESIEEGSPPVFQTTVWITILAILTIILAAGYLLWAKTQ